MKRKIYYLIPLLFFFALFAGCEDKITETRTFTANSPIYKPLEVIRHMVSKSEINRPLQNPGKIYFKDNLLFINELYEGVHIYNNSDPASPKYIGFIEIPANVDIAIKGNFLYADSYIDLVVIDIKDINNITEVGRLTDVFNYNNWAFNYDARYPFAQVDTSKGLVIGWEVKEVTEKVEYFSNPVSRSWGQEDLMFSEKSNSAVAASTTTTAGVGGSMARFSIYNTYLYTVQNSVIQAINISNLASPVEGSKIETSRNVETLFLYQKRLFAGTTTGMLVYSLDEPSEPILISQFNHIRSCDPVVVNDKYAFVTLRGGTACGGFTNQLDVLDISNIIEPKLIKSYPMTNPHGLGFDNNILFICDGDAGLKIYNAEDPLKIDQNFLKQFSGINAFDVIPMKGVLMMIGKDGLYQYSYKDLNDLKLLSQIKIEAK